MYAPPLQFEDASFEDLQGADARKAMLIIAVMAAHAFGEGSGVGVSFSGQRGWAQVGGGAGEGSVCLWICAAVPACDDEQVEGVIVCLTLFLLISVIDHLSPAPCGASSDVSLLQTQGLLVTIAIGEHNSPEH